MSSQPGGSPSAAFGLALAGGIIILAELVIAAIGTILTFFIGGLGGFFGLLSVVWGILPTRRRRHW